MQDRSRGALPLTEVLGGVHSEREAGHRGNPGSEECTTVYRASPSKRAARAAGAALPCQNSNNSNDGAVPDTRRVMDVQLEGGSGTKELFPPGSRRTAFALQLNVQAMCEEFGLQNVGFLTLTFAEHITDPKVAQKRMNSLTTGVLRPRYGNCIRVIERQKSGRIHYHLLVNVGADIRTGVDFTEFANGVYRSAPMRLRCEWAFWRKTAKAYGFGRTELLPIRSTTEAIGRYVGKYIAKHLNFRQMRDKGVRLVSYSGGRTASTRFAWASKGSQQWRRKLSGFVSMLHHSGSIAEPTAESMRRVFGPRWVWKWRDSIITFPLEEESDGLQRGVLPSMEGTESREAEATESRELSPPARTLAASGAPGRAQAQRFEWGGYLVDADTGELVGKAQSGSADGRVDLSTRERPA